MLHLPCEIWLITRLDSLADLVLVEGSCLRTGCCKERYNRRLHILDRASWNGTRQNVEGTLYHTLPGVGVTSLSGTRFAFRGSSIFCIKAM